MPASARKSSIGQARRGLQKAHIPYRGDNHEVGKKTGIAVQRVERKSDGFEPFEELLQQADTRTPPVPKARKKKQSLPVLDEEFDEDGEMSMDIDDSPLQYFANTRQAVSPSSARRTGSLSRHSRPSDVDFDEVPSPRGTSARKSLGNVSKAGPSRLSNSFTAHDMDSDSDPGGFDDYGNGGFDNYEAPQSPQNISFTEMDQDDDDDDQARQNPVIDEQAEDNELHLSSTSNADRKGKRKERDVPPPVSDTGDPMVEDEIMNGLADISEEGDEDEEDSAPESQHTQSKKAKVVKENVKKTHSRRARAKKENRPVRQGLRKSAREHYRPLEYWRGERIVYGRDRVHEQSQSHVFVPPIKEIIRIPKEAPEPLSRKKRTGRGRSKSKAVEEVRIKVVPVNNPEEGWDSKTKPSSVVLEFPGMEEVKRRIAFTSSMLNLRSAADDNWKFEKIFGDGEFIAAGILVLPPNGRKPSKNTKDNTYIFYVIEGAVNLKVHESSLILATGGMAMVPRGNVYFIENIADRESKLFFTQARKAPLEENEIEASIAVRRSLEAKRTSLTHARSTSAAPLEGESGRELLKAPISKRAMSTMV